MKAFFLLFLFSISLTCVFAQSKKKQIEELTKKVDSLELVLKNERQSAIKVIFDLDEEVTEIENDLVKKEQECAMLSELYIKEIKLLNFKLDSLSRSINGGTLTTTSNIITTQTPDKVIKTKKEILTNIKGKYPLLSIEGNEGANTMFETFKEEGRWKSISSSNIGGVRDATTNKLTNKDAMLLNDLHIEVDSKLNVKLLNARILILEVPFIENGMDYRVKSEENKKHFEGYTPSTNIVDNQLVLLANDSIDLSAQLSGNFNAITKDHVKLVYMIDENTFHLTIFEGDCCDSNTFIFKK